MAYSAVWGHSPVQRQNTNSKKLTIKKLSKSGPGGCTKFDQANSDHDNTFINFAFYMRFPDLIRVTSSAENIDLARKRILAPKRNICTIKNVFSHFYHLFYKIRSIG